MMHGIIYGISIAFILYFATLAIRQKNLSAMWFSFYLVCLCLLMSVCQGHHQQFIKPAFVNLNHSLFITMIGVFCFTSAKFLRTFLNIRFYAGEIDSIIHIVQWMGIGFIPLNLYPNPFTSFFNIMLIGAGPVLLTGVSVFLRIKGIAYAGFFTAGWIAGLVTFGINLLSISGAPPLMPGGQYLFPGAMISAIIFFTIAIMKQSPEAREYIYKDHLTGLANRRLFDQVLTNEWNRNLRAQKPLSVIIGGIDNFKAFTNTYGHTWGDECLKTVSRIFDKSHRRAGDFAARYKDETFIAILPNTLASEASFLAEKIRETIESLAIKHEHASTGKALTMSLGTGTMVPSAEKIPADIILLAKDALLQVKNKGQNQVVSLNQVLANE